MSFLEVRGIKKNFGAVEVLKGIDFSLEKGEVVAIIGSSGSGKTTLLRSLNFLERPDEGKVTLDGDVIFDGAGRELSDSEVRRRRLRLGLVFQSFNLFPQYTVLKNVTLAGELLIKEKLKSQGLKGKEKRVRLKAEIDALVEKARVILHTVGLDDKVGAYPCMLSGGQQQRVAIARALMMSPKILCFDEPTSALDPELTGEVLKVIRELKSSERTMIIVTHELAFAKSVSDKVMFLADGKIEEFGTPEEVFESPKSEKTKAFLGAMLKT